MMLVGAKAHFCASHTLPQHPGKHGHSYVVWVYVAEGDCVEDLQWGVARACDALDHTHLNDVMDVPPTMENVARFIAGKIVGAKRVIVSRPVEGLCAEWTA